MTAPVPLPPRTAAPPMPRWGAACAAAIVASHAGFAWVGRLPGISYSNDDSVYLLLGQSLRAFGYRDAYLVGAPIHTQYPPGWPLLLSILGLFTGDSVPAAMLFVTVLTSLALVALFAAMVRVLPVGFALIGLTAAAWSLATLIPGGRLMSEAPYLAASMFVLWAMVDPEARSARRLVLAGTVALLAAYVRTVGVSLLVSLVALWFFERRYRASLRMVAAIVLVFLPWLAWSVFGPSRVLGRSYSTDLGAQVEGMDVGIDRVVGLIGLAVNRLYHLIGLEAPAILPFLRVRETPWDNVLWVVVVVVVGGAGMVALWRRWRIVPMYLVTYLGLLSVWTWTVRRFVFPIQPLLWVVLLSGAWAIWQRFGRMTGILTTTVLLIGLPFRGLPAVVAHVRAGWACDRDHQYESASCYTEDQLAFFAATRYARDSLPASGIVMVDREAAFAYHSGRRVVHSLSITRSQSDAPASVMAADSVDYILLAALTAGDRLRAPRFLTSACRHLTIVRQFAPTTILFRFAEEPSADSASCTFLEERIHETVEESARLLVSPPSGAR